MENVYRYNNLILTITILARETKQIAFYANNFNKQYFSAEHGRSILFCETTLTHYNPQKYRLLPSILEQAVVDNFRSLISIVFEQSIYESEHARAVSPLQT